MTMTDLGTPARGKAYIRRITTAETYAGGKVIIQEQARDKVARQQFTVVAAGGYERCEDDECERQHSEGCHAHGLKAGDWVLVRLRSWELTPDPDVYLVKTDDIMGRFVE